MAPSPWEGSPEACWRLSYDNHDLTDHIYQNINDHIYHDLFHLVQFRAQAYIPTNVSAWNVITVSVST